MPKGNTDHQHLVVRDVQMPIDRPRGHNPACLRAGMQSLGTRCQHDGLYIKTHVKPAAFGKIALNRHKNANRCIKQQIIACRLLHGCVAVAFFDTQQAVEAPPHRASAVTMRISPDIGIIIMFGIAVGLAALEHRIGFGGDGITHWPGGHMDMPWLGVGAAWCALRHIEDAGNRLAGYRLVGKGPDR